MANPALEDAALLQQLFQAPLSPIQNYGTGLVALATAKRQRDQEVQDAERRRRQQVEDLTRAEDFTLQRDAAQLSIQERRDKAREAHEERVLKLHGDQQLRIREAELQTLSKQQREDRRKLEIEKAVTNGIDIKPNASLEDAIRANSQSQGRKLIAASKEAAQAMDAYAQYLGTTKQAVMQESMASAIANLDPKQLKKSGLTLVDLNDLAVNPAKMADLRAKAARSGNKEAFALLNEINSTAIGNLEAGMKIAETSRPALANLSAKFKLATENFQTLAKAGGVSEADSIEATKNLIQSANAPEAAPAAPALPPPPLRTGSPLVPGAAAPATAGQFPGIIPTVGNVVSKGVQAAAPVLRGVGHDVSSLLFGGNFVNPLAGLPDQRPGYSLFAPAAATAAPAPMAVTGQPAVPVSPAELSKLRLLKSLQDQNALQNQVAPTFAPLSGAGTSWTGGAGTSW